MSDLPRFDGFQPTPRQNDETTNDDLARDWFRHTGPTLFILGGVGVLLLIGSGVLIAVGQVEVGLAVLGVPIVAGYWVYRWVGWK